MSGLVRCPDLRNPDLGGSTVHRSYIQTIIFNQCSGGCYSQVPL